MEIHSLLGPAAVLVLWSMIVLFWMVITRFKAFSNAGITLSTAPVGVRYTDVEADMPAKVNWISHNYTHLMEQPTIFYAVIAILVLAGDSSNLNYILAWTYVGLRIVHSLWQILSNVLAIRVVLFSSSISCPLRKSY